ncbi:hypothetical protein [Ekhidna sp.]|uniref:hypothetical protein n=1 Tax=Ekhidna sp. TaxID=2608089 RepID=UPI003299998C
MRLRKSQIILSCFWFFLGGIFLVICTGITITGFENDYDLQNRFTSWFIPLIIPPLSTIGATFIKEVNGKPSSKIIPTYTFIATLIVSITYLLYLISIVIYYQIIDPKYYDTFVEHLAQLNNLTFSFEGFVGIFLGIYYYNTSTT